MKQEAAYYTIKEEVRVRVPVGACRFIAVVNPVENEQICRDKLEALKKEFPDATHHVFAYRLLFGDDVMEKSSDDREPAGSAGKPVLEVLRKELLVNVQAVIIRYFGGVKLGIGGLVRAYRNSATEGIYSAELIPLSAARRMVVETDYNFLGEVMKLVSRHQGEVVEVQYLHAAKIYIKISPEAVPFFKQELNENTRGQARLEEVEDYES